MPYSKISELPETFKNLPDEAKRQARAVINELLAKGEKEAGAITQAWGAVKKSWEQDKDGNWVKIQKQAELETVDIPGVEILAVGKWHGNKEANITTKALDDFVSAFDELTTNKELNYEPPVKLGHAESQKLLQGDGYPAAGWISSLKKVGTKLVADFKGVPKKLAEIINAGGYKKASAEFYQDYEIGGKKYPWVLKAVALLGADIPAVKSIADIAAQYAELTDEAGVPYTAIVFEESLDEHTRRIRDAFRVQFHKSSPLAVEVGMWVEEVYEGYVIAEMGGKLYKVPYSEAETGIVFDGNSAIEVKKVSTYEPAQAAGTVNDTVNNSIKNSESEVIMEKELRVMLGLDEKGDVLAAVKTLKEKAGAQAVSMVEQTALKEENTRLKTTLAERERDERVGKAIQVGKITPSQKDWANQYAMSDPAGFDAFVASAPVVVKLGEVGQQGGEPEDVQLTEAEIKIGAMMGVSKDQLVAAKKVEVK